MRGSRVLGLSLVAAFVALVVACVPLPAQTPSDPQIPGQSTSLPAFPNLSGPPSTVGPTEPPVPTTEPGSFSFGDTVTIHTSRGSTWAITPLSSTDPANDLMAQEGYAPSNNSRFVILEVQIENVGVIDTHPYYDLTFAFQPDNGPAYGQNSASLAAAPDDIGYVFSVAPGSSISGQVVVQVPADAPGGAWIVSGDGRNTVYSFT